MVKMTSTGAITAPPHNFLQFVQPGRLLESECPKTASTSGTQRFSTLSTSAKMLFPENPRVGKFLLSERASPTWVVQLIRKHFLLLPHGLLTRIEASARVLTPRLPVSHTATNICVHWYNFCLTSIKLGMLPPPRQINPYPVIPRAQSYFRF
jgi:hypothetical protein